MAKKKAVTTAATELLTKQQIPFALHQYEQDEPAEPTAADIDELLRVSANRYFQTLIAKTDDEPLSAEVPISEKLDLNALASAVGATGAEIASETRTHKLTGYHIGSVSPFGHKQPVSTIVDISALDFATVYISAGIPGCAIEMSPEDLVRLTGARTAPVGAA